jgi:hypothetical protein
MIAHELPAGLAKPTTTVFQTRTVPQLPIPESVTKPLNVPHSPTVLQSLTVPHSPTVTQYTIGKVIN